MSPTRYSLRSQARVPPQTVLRGRGGPHGRDPLTSDSESTASAPTSTSGRTYAQVAAVHSPLKSPIRAAKEANAPVTNVPFTGVPSTPGPRPRTPPPEAGPSRSKGKMPDPCNWGMGGIDDSDLNVEAQHDRMETWNAVRDVQMLSPDPVDRTDQIAKLKAQLAALEGEERAESVPRKIESRKAKMRKSAKPRKHEALKLTEIVSSMAKKTHQGHASQSLVPIHTRSGMKPVLELFRVFEQ
ncbi:hypothetical protein NEOLEDRAFT_1145172 [Neolentinus lepideus HHB14362 ss-1]|uniref:Uncharacterized protein n=1 Tax=Neolentinus lepideus HHB14362 ss-1 TaxID=1314782 RepID=A0A165VB87_9AGAM|nr:hypothetical protein NEOLEDRAFT_1145172 [Neolentinus lepideus HHB14362 ss-1]